MEAPEVPLESVQEHMHEHAEHSAHEPGNSWILGVAVSSAIFAALAALASLIAGHHANEALIAQIKANVETVKAGDQWSYYQAKGVKSAVLASKMDILTGLGKTPAPDDEKKLKRYEAEQKEINEKATQLEEEAKHLQEEGEQNLNYHVALARAVTMFQVSIAVAAISALTRKRLFWYVSLAFGLAGIFFQVSEALAK